MVNIQFAIRRLIGGTLFYWSGERQDPGISTAWTSLESKAMLFASKSEAEAFIAGVIPAEMQAEPAPRRIPAGEPSPFATTPTPEIKPSMAAPGYVQQTTIHTTFPDGHVEYYTGPGQIPIWTRDPDKAYWFRTDEFSTVNATMAAWTEQGWKGLGITERTVHIDNAPASAHRIVREAFDTNVAPPAATKSIYSIWRFIGEDGVLWFQDHEGPGWGHDSVWGAYETAVWFYDKAEAVLRLRQARGKHGPAVALVESRVVADKAYYQGVVIVDEPPLSPPTAEPMVDNFGKVIAISTQALPFNPPPATDAELAAAPAPSSRFRLPDADREALGQVAYNAAKRASSSIHSDWNEGTEDNKEVYRRVADELVDYLRMPGHSVQICDAATGYRLGGRVDTLILDQHVLNELGNVLFNADRVWQSSKGNIPASDVWGDLKPDRREYFRMMADALAMYLHLRQPLTGHQPIETMDPPPLGPTIKYREPDEVTVRAAPSAADASATVALLDDAALSEARTRVAGLRARHKPFNSAHEAHGVLAEELEEFWDEVRKKNPRDVVPGTVGADTAQARSEQLMVAELLDLAAAALRAAVDVRTWFEPKAI